MPPRSRSVPRQLRILALALALPLAFAVACRAASPGVPGPWAARPEEVRPTLEQIFLEPSIAGEAPGAVAISADGAYVTYEWRPTISDVEGKRSLAEGPGLHLHGTAAGAEPRLVADLLPPSGGKAERARLQSTWSEHGHLLAVARGKEIHLVDPERGTARLLYDGSAPSAGAESEALALARALDSSPGSGASAPPPPLEDVRSMSFEEDDEWLRASDGRELVRIRVDGSEIEWVSAQVDAPARGVQWSDDLSVAFAPRRTIVDLPLPSERMPAILRLPARLAARGSGAAQILRRAEGRLVTLEGMGSMKWLVGASLSPDGEWVFAGEEDRRDEPEPNLVPDYLGERVSMRETRSQRADDLEPPTRSWIWSTRTGERRELLLPHADRGSIHGIGWAPQPSASSPAAFALRRRSQDHREAELWCWRADTDELRRLADERDERWVGGPAFSIRWTPDGQRLVFGSERFASSSTPGRSQVFAVPSTGGEAIQLTEVAGEVSEFRLDDEGNLLVEASDADPHRRFVGRVAATAVRGEAAPKLERFPSPEGWTELADASRNGTNVALLHQELLVPADVWAGDDRAVRRLTRTVPSAFEAVRWIRPQRIEARSHDGTTVRAHVYLPPGTSLEAPDAPRASIVFVHGAGYLQNVTDSMTRYPLNAMFHSRLASMGYVVLDVDYRGSAGYGNAFRTDVQYHLGGADLEDLHAAVDELVERGVVDAERVGLYGGSYGGFLTLMALFTAPERWTAGAALRSVTDWRSYNPWYTQPRLGRPSTHPEAYRRSSPIDHVDGLRAPLLVLHGMVDTNVFAQDSIRLIEALIDRGKTFDAMLYPSQGHAFHDGPHWLDEYARIERFLLAHLGPPRAARRAGEAD